MAEMHQETNYVHHPIQKVVAFFLSIEILQKCFSKKGTGLFTMPLTITGIHGIYIGATEWAEITNTRGMSQIADWGVVATQQYESSAGYINKMSKYRESCYYSVNKKTCEKACPFNSLYWNSLYQKQDHFNNNPRMGMILNVRQKMDQDTIDQHLAIAEEIISNPDKF